jgi:hypothetical protein
VSGSPFDHVLDAEDEVLAVWDASHTGDPLLADPAPQSNWGEIATVVDET